MAQSDLVLQVSRNDEDRTARLCPAGGGRFAAIVFDMGSTLLEYENIPWPVLFSLCVDGVYERLIHLGHDVPAFPVFWEKFNDLLDRRRRLAKEEMREYRIDDLIRNLVRGSGIKLRRGELAALGNAYYAPVRRAVTVYPQSLPTLAALHEAGYRLGLLSNTCFRARDHREELEYFGLWPFFDAVLFTSTGKYRKPHSAPFREVCRRLNVKPDRCLYVGDRQKEDVLGPAGVGMRAVLVRRPRRTYEPGLTDAVEIESLRELPDLLTQ